MTAKVHHILTGEQVAAAPDRSGLGIVLSKMSNLLPIDLGIKYDLLSSRGKKAVVAIGTLGLIGGVVAAPGLITKGIEASITSDHDKLVSAQNKYIGGKHRTISFVMDGGNAKLRTSPAVASGDENKSGELLQGDKVSCSVEIGTTDGNTWGVVRDEKGNVGFVNINQNNALKEVPNPEGCPSEVEITTSQDVADRFAIQSSTGAVLPTFAELTRAPR